MKKIVCFHLDGCPYCHKAKRAFDELCIKNPAWKNIPVEWVEETRETPSELKNLLSSAPKKSTRRILPTITRK